MPPKEIKELLRDGGKYEEKIAEVHRDVVLFF
jgi:hypothetical protein